MVHLLGILEKRNSRITFCRLDTKLANVLQDNKIMTLRFSSLPNRNLTVTCNLRALCNISAFRLLSVLCTRLTSFISSLLLDKTDNCNWNEPRIRFSKSPLDRKTNFSDEFYANIKVIKWKTVI